MTLIERIMEVPLVYRLWQAPFVDDKLRPLLSRQDIRAVGRVLDVGCGPGTNSSQFAHADYLGVDINDRYIEMARKRHNRRFITADAVKWSGETTEEFDFILVNSFLHHIDDDSVRTLLRSLRSRVAPGGKFHIVEVVMPESRGIARTLAKLDRGKFVRPLESWRTLLSEMLDLEWFETFELTTFGVPCWHMVYAVGTPVREPAA